MNEKVKKTICGMKDNPHSFINREVSSEEVTKILNCIGCLIRQNLLENNNIIVHGIGTFALFQQKLPISHHPVKYIVTQKPVFQLSLSLASRYQLKWARKAYEVSLPTKQLNFSQIALNSRIQRSKVVLAMYELITWLERLLHTKQHVVLPFVDVGVLNIQGDKYRMDFSEEFLKAVSIQNEVHVVKKS